MYLWSTITCYCEIILNDLITEINKIADQYDNYQE